MKKALFIVAEHNFRDLEYIVSRSFLEQHGIFVSTASAGSTAVGRFGFEVKTDFRVELLTTEALNAFDVLVFVGGSGSLDYIGHSHLRALTIDYVSNPLKIAAAICAAPRIFLAWGILKEKLCVGNDWDSNFESLCTTHDALYAKGKNVVKDTNIITGVGPESSEAFALEIISTVFA